MNAEDDTTDDDVALWIRDTIEVVGLEGSATETRVLQLAEEGRREEALELLESVPRPEGTEETFWGLMSETASALGNHERVAEYRRLRDEHADDSRQWPWSAFDDIMSAVRSARTVTAGFSAVIDLCAEQGPPQDWARFRALALEPDVARLQQWLESLLVTDPPGTDTRVLWFGLCNPIRDGEPTSDLAVRGFAVHPDGAGPITWEPSNAEAGSEVLAQIHALAHPQGEGAGAGDASGEDEHDEDDESGDDAEGALCLADAGLVLRTLAGELAPELFVGQATERELLFGFDSGDIIRLGTISRDGLRLQDT